MPERTLPTPEVEEVTETETEVAPPWMTVLHNCDCHTFEQVVKQLQKAIACSESKGWEIAVTVSGAASGCAGTRRKSFISEAALSLLSATIGPTLPPRTVVDSSALTVRPAPAPAFTSTAPVST